jgi:hypothetical protein
MHAAPGDIVIDLDRLALALSPDGTPHHEYPTHTRQVARAARAAAISVAVHVGRGTPVGVWIIDTFPDIPRWRSAGAVVHTVNPGYRTCMARAEHERPEWVRQIIAEWYAKFSAGE